MTRRESLGVLLDRVLDGDLHDRPVACPDDPHWTDALTAFSEVFAQGFEASALRCHRLLERDDLDAETRVFAQATLAMTTAGWPVVPDAAAPDLISIAADALAVADIDEDLEVFLAYLVVEAALACARLALATALVDRFSVELGRIDIFLVREGESHPYRGVMVLSQVRLLAFSGRIAEAQARFDDHDRIRSHPILGLMYDAAYSFVLGNAADKATVRRTAVALETARVRPDTYLTAGCYTLVAYALIAIAEIDWCARFVLLAGQGPEMASLNHFDRALGLELMVAAAVAAEDLDAAESWQEIAQDLIDAPPAGASVRRLNGRVELLAGRPVTAAALVEESVVLCRADGRGMEAAESEIVLSRCKVALAEPGVAARMLEELVITSDEAGHIAPRRQAAKELRAIGRRLRPVPGSEWDGLSARERDVALMLAEGLCNREIAAELFVSEHTVRGHVSRVLAAFGTPSRTTVAARLAERPGVERGAEPERPDLTNQQRKVSQLIAQGLGNSAIATELGVSVRTVEKHVGDILVRWSLTSRVAVARAVVAQRIG